MYGSMEAKSTQFFDKIQLWAVRVVSRLLEWLEVHLHETPKPTLSKHLE